MGQTLVANGSLTVSRQGGRPAHLWHTVLENFCTWKRLQHWTMESRKSPKLDGNVPWFPSFCEPTDEIVFYFHALALAVLYIFSVDVSFVQPVPETGRLRAYRLNSTQLELVVLLNLHPSRTERASMPQHIIELIKPKVQAKVSKFHQNAIGILIHQQTCNSRK